MANNKKTVTLKDSYFQDGDPGFTINYSQAANYINAVLELQRLYNEKKIEVIHLGKYSNKEVDEAPIGIKTKTIEGELKTLFTTSHYIGCFCINGITFKIEPRFGNNPIVLNRLLSYACDVYIPQNSSGRDVSKNMNLWLLVILFRSLLKEAIGKGQIPKEYKTYSKNLRTYKGRLNIPKHIHYNLTNSSMFYCVYKKLTMDTIINRTIRYTYSIIKKNFPSMLSLLQGINEHDERLASFGVSDDEIDLRRISRINYNKMTIVYRPVIEICKAIILHSSIESANKGKNDSTISYFIDMADLWELYLLRVLQRRLPDYNVYSPNVFGGDFLMEDGYRNIRPDILIEDKSGNLRMIIDAKYKRYKELGNTASTEHNYVSRDDLNQMGTYMLNYLANSIDLKMYGVFTSPAKTNGNYEDGKDFHKLIKNGNCEIGLLNLNLESFGPDETKMTEELNEAEKVYISKIESLLCGEQGE